MKPLTIIGGGLAGLTLGILLRRENIPVTLHEAASYPRHRVCGEFLSGSGLTLLKKLNLESKFQNHGALPASSTAFFIPNRPPIHFQLPQPALCLSRFKMDSLLAEEFQNLGGDLKTNSRFKANPTSPPAGLIHATGRRRADSHTGHLFGLKAHATGARLSADLEIHFAPQRYIGLCRLSENKVNVCGLFYSKNPIPNLRSQWRELLSHSIPSLKNATWLEDTFCSVAGITLHPSTPPHLFTIGDAAAMIPPLTGNGMSMAFESAALAFEPLTRYSKASIFWTQALAQYSAAWSTSFSRRLRWANFTQRLVFHGPTQRLFYRFTKNFPKTPRLFFSYTR